VQSVHSRSTLVRPLLRRCMILAMTFVGSLFVGSCADQDQATAVPTIHLPAGKADSPDTVMPEDCPGGAPRLVDGMPAAWTIMVYQAGDNNLEDALEEDLNEMELGYRSTDQVNVVVQVDRYNERGVWRYQVRHDADSDVLHSELVGQSDEEPDSGSWLTLASFGQWVVTCYPADHYVVVVSGHGSGWSQAEQRPNPNLDQTDGTDTGDATTNPDGTDGTDTGDATTNPDGTDGTDTGDATAAEAKERQRANETGEAYRAIAFDDSTGTSIRIDELAKALRYISDAAHRESDPAYLNRLTIYGSDACLMQTVEVLDELKGVVTFVVGSEQTEPGDGWPYSTVLRELTARPFQYALDPASLPGLIVSDYAKSYGVYGGQGHHKGVTQSAVNVDYTRRLVNAMGNLSYLMTQLEEQIYVQVWDARQDATRYARTYVDLSQLLTALRKRLIDAGLMPEKGRHWSGDERMRDLRKAIDSVLELVQDMTVARSNADDPTAPGGVSLYFPNGRYSWVLSLSKYVLSPFSMRTGWGDFIDKLVTNHRCPYYEGF